MRTSVEFRCLTISAGPGARVMEDGNYRRRYRVRVQSDATNVTRAFQFTDSIVNERAGKIGLGPDELLWAFSCFVSDAQVGEDTFANFAADYGYDADSMTAHRTWQACKVSARKFRELFHAPTDPADVGDQLREMGVE